MTFMFITDAIQFRHEISLSCICFSLRGYAGFVCVYILCRFGITLHARWSLCKEQQWLMLRVSPPILVLSFRNCSFYQIACGYEMSKEVICGRWLNSQEVAWHQILLPSNKTFQGSNSFCQSSGRLSNNNMTQKIMTMYILV